MVIIFPEKLKLCRTKSKLTQREFAEKLGIITRSYQKYESGDREPPYEKLTEISRILNVSTDYLLGLDDIPNRKDC